MRESGERPLAIYETRSGWFVLVDDEAAECVAGALWWERARATLFGWSDVVDSASYADGAGLAQKTEICAAANWKVALKTNPS